MTLQSTKLTILVKVISAVEYHHLPCLPVFVVLLIYCAYLKEVSKTLSIGLTQEMTALIFVKYADDAEYPRYPKRCPGGVAVMCISGRVVKARRPRYILTTGATHRNDRSL